MCTGKYSEEYLCKYQLSATFQPTYTPLPAGQMVPGFGVLFSFEQKVSTSHHNPGNLCAAVPNYLEQI